MKFEYIYTSYLERFNWWKFMGNWNWVLPNIFLWAVWTKFMYCAVINCYICKIIWFILNLTLWLMFDTIFKKRINYFIVKQLILFVYTAYRLHVATVWCLIINLGSLEPPHEVYNILAGTKFLIHLLFSKLVCIFAGLTKVIRPKKEICFRCGWTSSRHYSGNNCPCKYRIRIISEVPYW